VSEAVTTRGPEPTKPSWARALFVSLPYLVLYIASIVFIAMTDSDPATSSDYWKFFMPLVVLVSVVGGWHSSGVTGKDKAIYIARQIIAWGAVLLIINLLFLGDTANFLNAEAKGFVVAYILGLAALITGIYIDWKMALYGLALIASAVGIAFLDDNAMMISIGGIALAGIVITIVGWRSRRSAAQEA
jgi:dipeptide/tripeptide permease